MVCVPPRRRGAAVLRGLPLRERDTMCTSTDTIRSLRGATSSMLYMSTRSPKADVSWLKYTNVASPSFPPTHCQFCVHPNAKLAGASAGPFGARAMQFGPEVGNAMGVFVGVGVTVAVGVIVGVIVMHAPATQRAP
jgi:hypothetical protein